MKWISQIMKNLNFNLQMYRKLEMLTNLHGDEGILLLRRNPDAWQVGILQRVAVLLFEVLPNTHLFSIYVE